MAFDPSRRLRAIEHLGDFDDHGPVEHGILHRLQALPDRGGHGDRRRLILDVFREAVVDQGGST